MRLHRDLNITQKSAYFLAHRLREAWSERTSGMDGPVEIDESLFGGKEKNKHGSKKLRAGRGAVSKTAVAGAKGRASGKIRAKAVDATGAETLQGFMKDHVADDATIYTDEAKVYRGLPHDHEAVRHSVSEHVNGVESFCSLLKRGYHGTFHHVSPKHLHRYVSESATCHNLRPQGTEDIMAETVTRMIGKRLTCMALTDG